jgi:hypothetical protein
MPFTLNDAFDDFARMHRLPDCAWSFLSRAGTWSARASKSGFVPSTMHAEFSDDHDQAVRALLAAGALRRVKAGVRIAESHCWTLLNARDVHRDSERQKAEAEERREKWRDEKQRQRAEKKAGQRGRIAAGVPAMSAGENADVHRNNPGKPEKPQVNGSGVQVDMSTVSTGTAKTNASDSDQDLSIGVGVINARAREDLSPETLNAVVAGISKKLKRIVTEAEARRAIAEWNRRAEEKGQVILEPPKFYATCIRRERLLEAIVAPPPNLLWVQLGEAPEPVPGGHAYRPDPDPFIDSCAHPGCGLRRMNARHVSQEANAV